MDTIIASNVSMKDENEEKRVYINTKNVYSCMKREFTTQWKIDLICKTLSDLLQYKNQKYGDSALKPQNIFYKGNATNSILIRLDDKLGRIMANTENKPRINDVCDIIGYCVLLLISLDVTKEDIEKLKD